MPAEPLNMTTTAIRFLEALGEGYLRRAGLDEVDRVVAGLDLRVILDVGQASAASPLHLVARHDAGHVTGFDVEAPVIEGRKLSAAACRAAPISSTAPGR